MTLPVVFVMGPTAAGKTALAVELARKLPVELISVDSALVYRGLDIGAARPDKETLRVAPHRLIDIRNVDEPYSAADFRNDALAAIKEVHANGRLPVLVGGTMMYFKALLGGLTDLPAADAVIRQRLASEAATLGWPALHQRLALVDAITAAQLSPNDSQRLQRALEVYEITGVALSEHHRRHKKDVTLLGKGGGASPDFPYNVQAIAVAPRHRATLHQRIAQRLEQMFAEGLVDEVRGFYQLGDAYRNMPALRAVGYRQVWDYLAGVYDYDTMQHKALVATRQLAKRQLTWLRSWPNLEWFYSDNEKELLEGSLAYVGRAVREMQDTGT